jgi:HrpA-like RNA helicase
MSATLQAEQIVKYFEGVPSTVGGTDTEAAVSQIPVVHVEGRAHAVQAFYLEDALAWTGFELESSTMQGCELY